MPSHRVEFNLSEGLIFASLYQGVLTNHLPFCSACSQAIQYPTGLKPSDLGIDVAIQVLYLRTRSWRNMFKLVPAEHS